MIKCVIENNVKLTKQQIKEWIICSIKTGIWFPLMVLVIHFIAVVFIKIYSFIPWFDIPMHFIGGISITYFFTRSIICAFKKRILGNPSLYAIILIIILLTSTVTIFWEFAEWIIDKLMLTNFQVSLDDTLLDMLLGILGGIFFIVIKNKKIVSNFNKYNDT